MKELLKELNDQLMNLRPDYYQALKDPLTENEIKVLEEQYKIQIPIDLKEVYKWKNGQNENCFDAFVNNSMFMSLEDVLESWEELTSMIESDFEIENWWNANWLPVFHNGGGCYICYDLQGIFTGNQGQLIEFWNKDNDRNVIAPNLEAFLYELTNYYKSTKTEDFDEYFEIEIKGDFPKSFEVE